MSTSPTSSSKSWLSSGSSPRDESFPLSLANLPSAILILDRDGKIRYANRDALRLLRASLEQLERESIWSLLPELRDSSFEALADRALATGLPESLEIYDQRLQAWLEIRVAADDTGLMVSVADISARVEAKRREQAAARRALQVYETMPDCIVLVDREFRFTFANQRAFDLLGGSDILGQNIFERFPGNRLEPYSSAYHTAMEQRIATQFEAHFGEPLFLWFKVQAQPSEDGIIIYFSDITARKEAELRERSVAAQLAQVLDVTSDAVVSLDREWNLRFLNHQAETLIDPNRKLLGQNHWEAFPAARTGVIWENYHRSMHDRVTTEFEVYYPGQLSSWYSVKVQPSDDGIVVFFRDISEEREQSERLRRQQELLTTVQETARVATWELDLDQGRIEYGVGAADIFGRPAREMTQLHDLLLHVPREYQIKLGTFVDQVLLSGQMDILEFPVDAPDGSTIWIEKRAQAVPAADGKRRLRGISIDITRRKADQAELVASEQRYRVLAELNPQAIWITEPHGAISYANQRLRNFLAMDLPVLRKGGLLEGIAPEDRERVDARWNHCLRTGEDYDVEARIWHAASNEWCWWRLRAAPVRDSSGNILYWLGVGLDIHELKVNAELLRAKQLEAERQHTELEGLYRTTPVGLALLDPHDFTFLNLNDREAEILGLPKNHVIGKALQQIAPIPGLLEIFQSVADGAVIRNRIVEGELPSRPGEARAWSVNYSPLYGEDGIIRAISTASIEITDQRRAEAALIQSEKLAAVGRLASSISHEINNPLEAITNLLYIIANDQELAPNLKTYVSMAQSELSRVSQIVTQTLRFHRQAVAPTLVSAADLVDAVIRLYTGRLANSSIHVDVRYDTHARIHCFENDIRQILNNLIANAIDAMRGGGRLIIRAHNATAPAPLTADPDDATRVLPAQQLRRGIRISVADTGHGMSAQVLARAFEPFFTTKDLNGTGLGLWISAGIVERHQGRLRVRSNDAPDRHYTVFSLFLPSAEQP